MTAALRPLFATALAAGFAAVIAGCASTAPTRYTGIPSSSSLRTNTGKDAARVPYRFAASVDWNRYIYLILDPVRLYGGGDAQFGKMPAPDQGDLAKYAFQTFSKTLGEHFGLTDVPGPDTLRVKIVLTGAETNGRVAGTLLRLNIAGGIYNGIQAMRGANAAFMGSVSYDVEVSDARSGRLLYSYVTKQYPNAMNMMPGFTSLGGAKAGLEKGANLLLTQLRNPTPIDPQ